MAQIANNGNLINLPPGKLSEHAVIRGLVKDHITKAGLRNMFMADKKNAPNDSKPKSNSTSKTKTLKQRLPKQKPAMPQKQEDYVLDSDDDTYTYYKDDLSDD